MAEAAVTLLPIFKVQLARGTHGQCAGDGKRFRRAGGVLEFGAAAAGGAEIQEINGGADIQGDYVGAA